MRNILRESLTRLFDLHATSAFVRAVEAGQSVQPLWTALEEQGLADALVPEALGGSGLGLTDLWGVLALCGEVACPVPLAATIVARGHMAGRVDIPEGAISLAAFGVTLHEQTISIAHLAFAATATWVLAEVSSQQALLLPVSKARKTSKPIHGSLSADCEWDRHDAIAVPLATSLRPTLAAITAAQMAGAMTKVEAMTIRYANERVQFGKPIGKFQAIQQQVAELAEEVAASRIAAEIGLSSSGITADPHHAALAKMRTSQAVVQVCAIAHAVHGAMGITQAYDLQLFTRRLHEGRIFAGSEIFWQRILGEALLSGENSFLDHIRLHLMP